MPTSRSTTVTVPAESYDLTTLETVKSALQLGTGVNDDYLSLLIGEASARAASRCNRVFAIESVVDTFRLDGMATPRLVLARRPVVSITSVLEDDVVLTATDYVVDRPAGILTRLDCNRARWWPNVTIVVSYNGGYVLPGNDGQTLPGDLEGAVIDLVRSAWYSRTRDPAIKSETTPGVYEVSYWVGALGEAGDMPPEVEGTLARHSNCPAA